MKGMASGGRSQAGGFRTLCAVFAGVTIVSVSFAAAPVGGVLTITGGTMSQLTEELGYIRSGAVTKIVKTTGTGLTLDVDISEYKGSWDVQGGRLTVTTATGAFGTYGDGTDEVVFQSGAMLRFNLANADVIIDKPVRFKGSSSAAGENTAILSIYQRRSGNTFKRKLTIEGEDFGFFGAGGFTCEGGLDAPNTTIVNQGAGYSTIIKDAPCDVKCFRLTSHKIIFETPGNKVGQLKFGLSGMYAYVRCDKPFADDGAPAIVTDGASEGFMYLNGFEVAVRDLDASTGSLQFNREAGYESGYTTLRVVGNEDAVLGGGIWRYEANVNVVKAGSGTLTIKPVGYCPQTGNYPQYGGTLTVEGGKVAFDPGYLWLACAGVTLAGGSLETCGNLSCVPLTVASPEVADALKIADGTIFAVSGLTVGDETKDVGLYGGDAADVPAENKVAWCDATSTGRLSVDNVLVIDCGSAKSFSSAISADQLAKVQDNTYTRIVKRGSAALTLDTALTFSGSWTVESGSVIANVAEGFGVYRDGSDEVQFLSADSKSLYTKGGTIDKPIHFYAPYRSGDGLVYMESTTTTFSRLMTFEGEAKLFFGGSGTIYSRGGFVQKKGTVQTSGASGAWHISDVPAQINAVSLGWLPLYLEVPGNAVGQVFLPSGGRLYAKCEGALSGCPLSVSSTAANPNLGNTGVWLGGYDAVLGDIDIANGVTIRTESQSAVTLTVANESDCTLLSSTVPGAVNLVKDGDGVLTLSGTFTYAAPLAVNGGTLVFAAGTSWATLTGITLNGGRLVTADSANLPEKLQVAVVPDGATNVFSIPSGVTNRIDRLTVAGVDQGLGTFGSAASGAEHPSALFDAASLGVLHVYRIYDLPYASGVPQRTLTEAEIADIRANKYSCIRQTGGHILQLTESLDGYEGEWDIQGGCVRIETHDHALGSDSDDLAQALRLNYASGAYVLLHDGTANRPIVFNGTHATQSAIASDASTSNALGQAVVMNGDGRMTLSSGTKLVIGGGITCAGDLRLSTASHVCSVYGRPIVAQSLGLSWGNWSFFAPSNRIGRLQLGASSTVNVRCDDCFTSDTSLVFSEGTNPNQLEILNLEEHDLTCGGLQPGKYGYIFARRSSYEGADLDVALNLTIPADMTNTFPHSGFTMRGKYTVTKGGPGALEIAGANPFVNTDLTLTGGKLIYDGAAADRWKLNTLSASEDTSFLIGLGKTIKVNELYLGETKMKPAVYAGKNSPLAGKTVLPNFDDDCLGCVRLPGALGMLLLVR